uniref:Voltage-dependent calcium channel alpha-2/delta subunit conserved region domain-containing protein n=1 Tax=Sinocyclocheilus grahami TaxID=75366 RepID=A0A672SGA7_SINGR
MLCILLHIHLFMMTMLNRSNPSLYALFSVTLCCFTQVGKFFGEIDGSVMAQLLKSGLFKRVTLYDYQAMCKNAHHHVVKPGGT